MRTCRITSFGSRVSGLALVGVACLVFAAAANAGNPHGAAYCPTGDAVFWFVQVSDPHIGTSGDTDADRLRWIVTTGRSVITPRFIVATGDLTDSTNGNLFGYPNGPYQREWDEYRNLLDAAGVDVSSYFDVPGNHDAYNDRYFAYYLANSVQGSATGHTQLSWTVNFPFGKYHFLGVNTADNTGAPFRLTFPFGDHAGLDADELDFITQALANNADARLTFVFGHHPLTDTGQADDTWLFYGHQDFVHQLDSSHASVYGYGHTHDYAETLFTGDSYTGLMTGDGVHYDNIASLGKSNATHYMVYAVDCDGVSAVPATVGTWPVVIITAPVNAVVGAAINPYAYAVPAAAGNPIRALVFDAAAVTSVAYRIDAGTWWPMTRRSGNTALWEGTWDASSLAAGTHTIEVRATGSTTRSDIITVNLLASANRAPVANDDAYTTQQGVTLTVTAPGVLQNDTDADGDALTATTGAGPAHGTLTLNENGAFSYVPAAGFSGSDRFTYTAADGAAVSNTATVTLTITTAPVTDTVTITAATYTRKTRLLNVQATSSGAPAAKLTVYVDQGGGYSMTYNAKRKKYSYQATMTSTPTTVSVRSDLGGTATRKVAIK